MNQLLLHVGVHKTGSSSIQNTLDTNRERLRDNGIKLYPGRNHSEFYRGFTDTPESFHRYYRSWNRDAGQQQLRVHFKNYFLANTDIDHLVSGEDICLLSASALSTLNTFLHEECGFSKVTVVCFLREPLDYLNSSLQQYIKPGLVTLDEIENNSLLSYRLQGCPEFSGGLQSILSQIYFPIPQKLVAAFGTKNVRFTRFENAARTGLVQKVLNSFEHNKDFQCVDIKPSNTSMSHEASLLLAEYNNRNPLLDSNMEINRKRVNAWVTSVIRSIPGEPTRLIDSSLLDFRMIETGIDNINSIANSQMLTPISEPPDRFKNSTIFTFSSDSIAFLKNLIDISGMMQSDSTTIISTEQLTIMNKSLEKRYKTRLRSVFHKFRRLGLSYSSRIQI